MAWQDQIPLVVRVWINDLSETPNYSDDRLEQLIVIAAQYTIHEMNFNQNYVINIMDRIITPDPTTLESPDHDFIGFVALKSACMLDQSTFRTRAATEGIRASLGSANLTVQGGLAGYQAILDEGPCAIYQNLRLQYEFGNANGIRAMLSPFVGNKFDPRAIQLNPYRSRDIYS